MKNKNCWHCLQKDTTYVDTFSDMDTLNSMFSSGFIYIHIYIHINVCACHSHSGNRIFMAKKHQFNQKIIYAYTDNLSWGLYFIYICMYTCMHMYVCMSVYLYGFYYPFNINLRVLLFSCVSVCVCVCVRPCELVIHWYYYYFCFNKYIFNKSE